MTTVPGDACSRIIAPPVREYIADDDVTGIEAGARGRGSK